MEQKVLKGKEKWKFSEEWCRKGRGGLLEEKGMEEREKEEDNLRGLFKWRGKDVFQREIEKEEENLRWLFNGII